MRKSKFAAALFGLTCGLLLLAGCGEGEQIRTYPVPTASHSILGSNDPPVPVAGAPGRPGGVGEAGDVATYPARMLVAMAEQGPQTWFFKLMGPADAVAEHEQEFHDFIGSVQFSGGKPKWTTPSGWSAQGQSGLRLETFHLGNHTPPLELTVIPLGTLEGGGDQSILANLNRWREQLQLPPITIDKLAGHIERVKLQGGAEAVVMDLTGNAVGDSAGQPLTTGGPMANRGNSGGPATAGPRGASPPSDSSPISYDKPEGWQDGEKSQLRLAAFDIADGDKQALVAVFRLPLSGTLANVNRWRGQIGLEAVTQEQLDAELKAITVDGIEGQYAKLVGEKQTILAVIVNREDQAWFFKLQGDVELAKREQQQFESFVKSVKFK